MAAAVSLTGSREYPRARPIEGTVSMTSASIKQTVLSFTCVKFDFAYVPSTYTGAVKESAKANNEAIYGALSESRWIRVEMSYD